MTTDLFGQARAPASRSAPLEKATATRTSATYGRTGTGSSASAALQQSLASRLMQRCELDGSTMFAYRLSRLVTPSGRSIFRLRASAHRTSDSAFTSWRSPAAQNAERGGQDADERIAAGHALNLQDQATLAPWPSPNAGPQNDTDSNWEARREEVKAKGINGNGFGMALGMAASLSPWPTPTKADGASAANATATRSNPESQHHAGATLTDAASWATPTSRDHKDGACSLKAVPVNALLGRQALLTDSGATPSGSPAATARRGQLNPALSRWLMALPKEWDEAAIAAHRRLTTRRRRA